MTSMIISKLKVTTEYSEEKVHRVCDYDRDTDNSNGEDEYEHTDVL